MMPQHWLAIGVAVVLLGWQFWPGISSLLGKVKLPTVATGGTDQDVADLAALKLVQARFVRLNCTDGKAAVQVCFEHFFHEAKA